jgi:hypothetical protein
MLITRTTPLKFLNVNVVNFGSLEISQGLSLNHIKPCIQYVVSSVLGDNNLKDISTVLLPNSAV